MAESRVSLKDESVLVLEGDLLFGNITVVLAQAETLVEKLSGAVDVDFSGVDRVDSSALSLWLCLLRRAEASTVSLKARGVPEPMLAMAGLVGLERYFSAV